nr:unnamed protein product [Spirometra erinaceieuropaei]
MPANTTLPKDVSHDSVGEEPCGSYAITVVSESNDDNGNWRNAERTSHFALPSKACISQGSLFDPVPHPRSACGS